MKFAIAASDSTIGIWESFAEAGWESIKLFTSPVDNRIRHNDAVLEYAKKLGIEVQSSRLRERDLVDLAERGCDALIVASYNWRIGDWAPFLKYAINFHPSPLPLARGAYPIVQAILGRHQSWGVTCHKLDADFDTGPILAGNRFSLTQHECHESLDIKTQLASRLLAGDVAGKFIHYWDNATPQGEGTYFKQWTAIDRTLDFSQSVDDVMCRIRAFGLIECIATINAVTVFVHRAVGWPEVHGYKPGVLVNASEMKMLVAVKDGFVQIIEWSFLPPDFHPGTIRR